MSLKTDRNAVVKEYYAEYLRLPNAQARKARDIPGTKAEFAQRHQVDRTTLWHWENDPEFMRSVHNDVLSILNIDEAQKIIWGQKIKAFEGNTPAAKLLLEWAGLVGTHASRPMAPKEDVSKELLDYTEEELQKIVAMEDAQEISGDSDYEEDDAG